MRADVSDEAEKDGTGEAEEDVPKRTVIEDGSTKPNGMASRGTLGGHPAQLELPMSSAENGADDRIAERARAIVDSLDKLSSEEVFAAFEELDQLPSDVVRAALEETTGPAPDPEQLDEATRRAHGFPARPLRLRTVAVTKDADIFDLGPVAEEQLRRAGKAYDGRDLEPEERLDGEVEDSFAGTLEHRVLVDADQPGAIPVFDVLLYAGDAGTIFRAGTTDIVGAIAYGVVEMKDKRARMAVQDALARPIEQDALERPIEPAALERPIEPAALERPIEPEAEPTPERAPIEAAGEPDVETSVAAPSDEPRPKKAAAKKKTAAKTKSAAAQKAGAAKKGSASAQKAGAAKKAGAAAQKAGATAKKASTKKATAKKATAKDASADAVKAPKKTSTKKATAKKTAAKRATTKKPADD